MEQTTSTHIVIILVQDIGYLSDFNKGILLQFGKWTESQSATDYKYYPIAFQNRRTTVGTDMVIDYTKTAYFVWIGHITLSNCLCGIDNGYGGAGTIMWIAVGF